jgi:hypothetical protein
VGVQRPAVTRSAASAIRTCETSRLLRQASSSFWLGHAGQDMSDPYDKAKNDVQFRKEVAERAGLGFELPYERSVVGPNGPKIESEVDLKMAANA